MADSRPDGYETSDLDRKKAKAFFDRGNTVAGTGNYDYAIEMYLSTGCPSTPTASDAHQTLRGISLTSQGHRRQEPWASWKPVQDSAGPARTTSRT